MPISKVEMKIDGQASAIELLSCTYSIYRAVNEEGQPHGDKDGGRITVTANSDDVADLWKWAASKTDSELQKTGTITFRVGNKNRVLDFTNGHAVQFQETYVDKKLSNPVQVVTIQISAQKIKMDGLDIENEWKLEKSK